MAQIQPFQWFGNQAVTPQQLASTRSVAAALAQSAPAPKTFWEGLQNATGKVGGAVLDWKANQDQYGAQKAYAEKLAALGDNPSRQDLIALASDPFANEGQSAVTKALLSQNLQQSDPGYQLDLATKKATLGLDLKKLGGNFTGDSLDAQAWNILQTTDPTSREYATAYSIINQPKQQLVQTANGLVPVSVQPQLPDWVVAPGTTKTVTQPSSAIGDVPPASPTAAIAPSAPSAPVVPGAPSAPSNVNAGPAIPGTKQPATEQQARNHAIGSILLNEIPTVGANFTALADPKGQLLGALPGGIGNAWQDPKYQQAASAVSTSVSDILYSLSGASSNPGEVINQIKNLTPQFGDQPPVIADKLNRFKAYVRAIASEANDPGLVQQVETAIGTMTPPATVAKPSNGLAVITGDADFEALPSGAHFKGPDGVERVKP